MDVCLSICMEKLCQCRHRKRRYAYRTTWSNYYIAPRKCKRQWGQLLLMATPRQTSISYYSLTNFNEETVLIAFYNELFSSVLSIPKHNVLIIGGYMNAWIGKNVNNKFSLHNSSNRNGEHLTENKWTCFITKFQKRKGKLWTYTYINNANSQIDYILINK